MVMMILVMNGFAQSQCAEGRTTNNTLQGNGNRERCIFCVLALGNILGTSTQSDYRHCFYCGVLGVLASVRHGPLSVSSLRTSAGGERQCVIEYALCVVSGCRGIALSGREFLFVDPLRPRGGGPHDPHFALR